MIEDSKDWNRVNFPSELYRFRSASTKYFEDELLRAVRGQEYFFSPIASLNDPFDCNPVIEDSSDRDILKFYRNIGRKYIISEKTVKAHYPDLTRKMIIAEMKKSYRVDFKNVRKTRSSFRNIFQSYRQHSKAVCLTEDWESPLHWAHYADAHSGISYCFKVVLQEAELIGDDLPLAMDYVRDRPVLSDVDLLCWLEGNDFEKNPEYALAADSAFNALNLTKSMNWKYEKEWRVQKRFAGIAAYKYTPALRVESIILGARCSTEVTRTVTKHCAGYCKVFSARLDDEKFSLLKEEI